MEQRTPRAEAGRAFTVLLALAAVLAFAAGRGTRVVSQRQVRTERLCEFTYGSLNCVLQLQEQGLIQVSYGPQLAYKSSQARVYPDLRLSLQQFFSAVDQIPEGQALDQQEGRGALLYYGPVRGKFLHVKMTGVEARIDLLQLEFRAFISDAQFDKAATALHYAFLAGFLLYFVANLTTKKSAYLGASCLVGCLLFGSAFTDLLYQHQVEFVAVLLIVMDRRTNFVLNVCSVLIFALFRVFLPSFPMAGLPFLGVTNLRSFRNLLFLALYSALVVGQWLLTQMAEETALSGRLLLALFLLEREDAGDNYQKSRGETEESIQEME